MFTSNYETESHKIVQIILTITARKDTVNPVMNRLTTEKRVQVLSALVEGNSINSIVRMTGTAKHTVLKLLDPSKTRYSLFEREISITVQAKKDMSPPFGKGERGGFVTAD